MKIIEINLKKGFVKVRPETFDDLWHLYNIIYKNDEVYGYTSRQIKSEEKYARPQRGKRISVFLGIKVENITWDQLLGRLKVHGTVCEETEKVPAGVHHTLKIDLNSPVTIIKKKWSKHHVKRLKEARKLEAPIIVLAIDYEGYSIATTAQYGINIKLEERIKLPGKLETEQRKKAIAAYFRKALNSLTQIWNEAHRFIVILGVGFVKNDFVKFVKRDRTNIYKYIVDVKSVNNYGVAGIYEAFRSGVFSRTINHLRILKESEVIEEILRRLGKNEKNIRYGLEEVQRAVDLGAVVKLILADMILRQASNEERLSLEKLMRTVEKKRGTIMVISTEHEAGEKLLALGGIVAFLRFQF